jgi:general secretion pathway protein G
MQRRRGFTFLEVMVVLLVLGLLAALVTPSVLSMLEESKKKVARLQMDELHAALKAFRLDQDRYPTASEGLNALVQKAPTLPHPDRFPAAGYLSAALPLDPWGRPYLYLAPGRSGAAYELISRGPDPEQPEDDLVSPCPDLRPSP